MRPMGLESHAQEALTHTGKFETGLRDFSSFKNLHWASVKIIQQGSGYQDFHNYREVLKHYVAISGLYPKSIPFLI